MLVIAVKILLAVFFLASAWVLALIVGAKLSQKELSDERLKKLNEEPEYDETIDYLS